MIRGPRHRRSGTKPNGRLPPPRSWSCDAKGGSADAGGATWSRHTEGGANPHGLEGEREARGALRNSLPLLHEAKSVPVVQACDSGIGEGLARKHVEDVAQYLTGHRISVRSATAGVPKHGIAAI